MIGDMDIGEFLQARLDEDEQQALDAAGWDTLGVERDSGMWHREGLNSVVDSSRRLIVYGDGPAPAGAQADHLACHDPARVLREVAAKRKIIAEAEHAILHLDWSAGLFAETVLGALATAYLEHPDYDPRWAL